MEILFVCVSSTICVYRTAKWFKLFVRGTFETEKLRKLSGPTENRFWELWRRLVEVFTSTLYLLCVSL